MKSLKYSMSLAAMVALVSAVQLSAAESTSPSPFLGVLTAATSAELPAKAAGLVTQADAKNLKQTTIAVIKSAVGLNPAAAPAIVGNIAQSSPTMAATAAATAATLVPDQADLIARAAAAAAPTQAGSIVEAICRVLPKDYQHVAIAVAEMVPGAGKEILAGIAAAMPQLKSVINQTLASYDGKIPSVGAMLAQVAQTDSSANALAQTPVTPANLPKGPTVGPPLVPISGTPTVLNPSTGGEVPTGGRNYATP